MKNIVGLDCGNSSIRVFFGKYDGKCLSIEMVDKYDNEMVKIGDYFYWDILHIYQTFVTSLKKITRSGERVDSIGVCTFGVDFALFDNKGNMIANPLSYRNAIGLKHLEGLNPAEQNHLFKATGILCDKINSLYMMQGIRQEIPSYWLAADKILMMPDIINFMLTGVMLNEPSELSTTQCMDVKTKLVSREVCGMFNIPYDMFSPIGVHGKAIGNLRSTLKEELGIGYDIPVICVPSHDTASAVVPIPVENKDFVFISSGTWSLIGTELLEPLLTDEVFEAGLTNEVGAYNRITLLKNNAGLFIIQRIRKEIQSVATGEIDWDVIVKMAETVDGSQAIMDVNDVRFFNPSNMSEAIWSFLRESKQVDGELNWSVIIRCVYESLALSYAKCIESLEKVTKKNFDSVYVVGGGSQNELLNRLTAKRSGKMVHACEQESTVLGNISTQLSYFDASIGLDEVRAILGRSMKPKIYVERFIEDEIQLKYRRMFA